MPRIKSRLRCDMIDSAMPNSTENNSTCNRSPRANAPTTEFGTIMSMKLDDAACASVT